MVFFRKKWPQLYTYASIPTTSGGVQKKSWQPGKKQDLHNERVVDRLPLMTYGLKLSLEA